MQFPRAKLAIRRILVVVAIVSTAFCGRARAQNLPSALAPDEGLDAITQRSAAARLLAALGPNISTDAKVGRLIDRLVLRDSQEVQAAVTALTILSAPAVPSIIKRIDDRRDMQVNGIAFESRFPGAFEAVRQYGTAKVIDCLNHVLNDITGESFGFIDISMDFDFKDQRAANAERGRMVVGWRGYLARGKSSPRAPAKALPMVKRAARPVPSGLVECWLAQAAALRSPVNGAQIQAETHYHAITRRKRRA